MYDRVVEQRLGHSPRSQLSFVAGTDPDVAQMQVQNKVQQAMSRLPQAVQDAGRARDQGRHRLPDDRDADLATDPAATSADIGDYVNSTLVDVISRIDGVGDVQTSSAPGYAMRIWLDPAQAAALRADAGGHQHRAAERRTPRSRPARSARCRARRTSSSTPSSPRAASCRRSTSSATWCCACSPTARRCAWATWRASSWAATATPSNIRFNGQPSPPAWAICLASGANALARGDAVKAKLAELAPFFPTGMRATVTYDTTPFVQRLDQGRGA